jgi:hypothetical protein
MFFTNLQEYSMHKSVIILMVLFLGFDVSAGESGSKDSEIRRLAALGIDSNGLSHDKKKIHYEEKRQFFDSGRSVEESAQVQHENDELRSKLAVSPEELSRGGEAPNPDRLSLNSGSRGTSPMTFEIPSHDELSQVTPPIVISKPCQKKVTGEGQCFYIDSPCGSSSRDYFGPSSFPGDGVSSLLSGNKKVSLLAPYSHDYP